MEYDKSLTFKICENSCLNYKNILIQIELNYNSQNTSLYKYNIQKIKEKNQLEFKSYTINWYTNYEFSPINVQSKDIIIISTNHSNTVFPYNDGNYKIFNSFYNGYLFVSFPDKDLNKNKYIF